jgi:hypothetical protein
VCGQLLQYGSLWLADGLLSGNNETAQQRWLMHLLHAMHGLRYNERKVSESRGVIDGDLIEALLDLAPGDVQKVGGQEVRLAGRQG